MSGSRSVLVVMGVVLASVAASADLPKPSSPRWAPVSDDVYLQESSRQFTTETPLTAVAAFEGTVYAGGPDGLRQLDGEALEPASGLGVPVTALKTLAGGLWLASPTGLWRRGTGGDGWRKLSPEAVTDLCEHDGTVVVLTDRGLFRAEDQALKPLLKEGVGTAGFLGVASYAGTLYLHTADRVALVEQGRLNDEDIADWGRLQPGCTVRDILSSGSRLVFATDEGLAVLRGMTWYPVQGEDGLCYEDTTCLAPGFARDLWIGTSRGAIRQVGEEFQYFGYQRWLPNDRVNAIAAGDRSVYIATDGGLGIIDYEPYTLQKKAAWYDRWLEEWGQKRLGFTHKLDWNPELNEWVREVSDNDVGFSSHYLDALCFKYAVTKDPAVRAEALDMMKTLKWSESITGIPGFPARSIWAVGEKGNKAMHGSGGLPAEWHETPDGLWQWKGDTSSDEVDAQIYATSLFLELVAESDAEVDMAREHLRRIVGHIVDNGWVLRDVDGQPTRWARWDPEYLQRPYGFYARGLNGMEAFNYVTTAYHFTGDSKFSAGKQQLIEWEYPKEILRQKLTFHPGFFTHFDDRLAFYSYFPLIRYESDAELKALWRRSLERSWEVKRIEGLPWFNFIYGALTGNDCENERSAQHLREWPLDCRQYSYTNSHRSDLQTPKGYTMYSERIRPLSVRETTPMRWDSNFMKLDESLGGNTVTDPAGWLDAYWMGRYYGFIEAPTTTDPGLLGVEKRSLQLGAKPYDGPPRPF